MDLAKIFGTFETSKIDETTWKITALEGSLLMYLLEGKEAALLIDTAYGFGNLRAVVEKLTDKPIQVVNTHGHLDHVGSNGEWEKVYMHTRAIIDMATLQGGPCDISTLPYPDYEKALIEEGVLFELGDRTIEVIDISAHSNGSLAFLDSSHRLLFTGDEIESQQVLMYNLIEAEAHNYVFKERIEKHLRNMEKLANRFEDFDFICPGHNGALIDKTYINDFIGLSQAILNKTVVIEEKLNHPYIEQSPEGPLLRRAKFGRVSFFVKASDLEGL